MNYIPRADKIIIPITGFEPTAVSSESVTIPAGSAGSVVNFFLTKKPILDSHNSWFGGKGDTSLALTSATFTNEVSPFTADEDLTNGDYWIDYLTGKGRGKKANTGTSMTANYYVGSSLGATPGGGFTSPMANDTYLEGLLSDGVTAEDVIGIGSDDVVRVGSLTLGRAATLISTDGSYTTSVTVDGNNIALVQGTASDEYIEYKMSAFPFEESLKLETASSLSSGLDSQIRILSQASSDGDVIYQTSISALSDAQNEVQYFMQRITQTIAQDGVESTDVLWRVVNEGSSVNVLGINKGRLYTPVMPNFRAEAVTGGVGYFQIETSLAGGNYRSFIGAGTTVPADASGNVFSSSAIFTDTDATVDTVLRTYINQGTDSNARFRAVATYTAAGQLMTPNTNNQVLVYGGTSSVAGLTFVGMGTNSGLYSSASGVLNLTLGGTERVRFQLTSMRWAQGTASAPQHTLAADNDTGMWLETGVTGFSVDSTEIGRFDANGLVMQSSIQAKKATDIASASTITLGAGNSFDVTGTATINYITTTGIQAGTRVLFKAEAACVFAHNTGSVPANTAPLKMNGAANDTMEDGEIIEFWYDGAAWRQVAPTSKTGA